MTRTASPTAVPGGFEATRGPGIRAARGSAWFCRVASEPLVHFSLLGALVFAAHRLLAAQPEVPTIEVSVAKQSELAVLFEQRKGKPPDEVERKQLLQRYVEEEAMFREGLRLSLVETDPGLRGQLVARVRGMLQSELEQKPPTDTELRRHFEQHRADYAIPETISFREYWIHRGPQAGSDAGRLMQALRAAKEPDQDLPAPTDHSGRSQAQLVSLYDEEVARALWTLPNAGWHELRSERGIHIVRVEQHKEGSEPAFADLRERVNASYQRDRASRALQTELARLTSQWRVNVAERP